MMTTHEHFRRPRPHQRRRRRSHNVFVPHASRTSFIFHDLCRIQYLRVDRFQFDLQPFYLGAQPHTH